MRIIGLTRGVIHSTENTCSISGLYDQTSVLLHVTEVEPSPRRSTPMQPSSIHELGLCLVIIQTRAQTIWEVAPTPFTPVFTAVNTFNRGSKKFYKNDNRIQTLRQV